MTLVAASIAVQSAEVVAAAMFRALRAAEMGADLIEWRIDALANEPDPLSSIRRLVLECPRPCIVTCRPQDEGGQFVGDEATAMELFEAIVQINPPPRYLDIELATFQKRPSEIRGWLAKANARSDLRTSLILSTHDFHSRPRDLLQRIETMVHEPACAVMKVAWHARSLRDNLEAFDLLSNRSKPMIALCMGQFGLMSRVLAPKFGGFLTFASDSPTTVTAPGQPTITELKSLYRFDRISPSTKVYGVIGWPVEHSLSPRVHNAAFEALGIDAAYVPLPIPGGPTEYEHFKATVGALIDHRGLDFRGASVTIPHKENLLRFVRERGGRGDELAEQIGAANTLIVGSAGGLLCLNTDCPAAVDALCAGMGIERPALARKRIAVIGAGGAARAVVAGLTRLGCEVVIFNRSVGRASALIDSFGGAKSGDFQTLGHERFDVYINCTSVGMQGGGRETDSPLPPDVPLDENSTVFDTVYVPPRTPLIRQAQARGARTISGIEMFVRQAAMQFERFTGKTAPPEVYSTSGLGGGPPFATYREWGPLA